MRMERSKQRFLKNMVGFSMVTWISFALGFIATPISTRLFAPAELARVSMFGTYTSLFCSVCYLGLDQAFVRFFRENPGRMTPRSLLTFCLSVALGFGIASSAVLLGFWRSLSKEIVGQPDFSIFLCLCLYSCSLVIFRFLSLCYRMEQNALLYTIQGVVHALLTKIAYLAVGLSRPTGRSAILALTVLMALFTLVFIVLQRGRLDLSFPARTDREAVRELARYALPLVPLSVLSWLNTSVSTLSLKHLLGYEATGIFSSALGLASTINIIQTGFNTYWAPYVLENYQSDDRQRFYTVHRLMACMLTLFGLGITLLQSPVFLLLGKSYRGSVVFFPFLFLSPICYCLGDDGHGHHHLQKVLLDDADLPLFLPGQYRAVLRAHPRLRHLGRRHGIGLFGHPHAAAAHGGGRALLPRHPQLPLSDSHHCADAGGLLLKPPAFGRMEIRRAGAGAGAGLRAVPAGASHAFDHRRAGT